MLRSCASLLFAAMACVLQPQTVNSLFTPAPGSPLVIAEGPGEIVLMDINGDGKLDMLTRHLLQKFVAVQLGDGTGHFVAAPGSPLTLKYMPGDIKLADLNGDKILDLAITHSDSDSVDIFFGNGKGSFSLAANSPLLVSNDKSFYTRHLDLIDLNEDGHLDLVTSHHRRNSFASLLGNGRGEFRPGPATTIQFDAEQFSFAPGDMFGDLDGDGHLDLVIVNVERDGESNPGQVRLLKGDGKGAFKESAAGLLSVPAKPHFVRLSDVNGDQRPDIITSHDYQITVLLNNGNWKFTPAAGSPYQLKATPFAVAVADVNHDHQNDLIAATVDSVTILLGGKNEYKPAPGSPFRAGPGAYNLTLADINNDGKLDIAASSFDGNAVTLLFGR